MCVLSGCFNHKETANSSSAIDTVIDIPDRYEPKAGILKDIYMDAKWRYYCSFCDSPVVLKSGKRFTCGEFEARLGWLRDSNSTTVIPEERKNIALSFEFYYHDTPVGEMNAIKNRGTDWGNYIDGIVYAYDHPKLPRKIFYGIGIHTLYEGDTIDSERQKAYGKFRLMNPLQPEVIFYIRENAARIHPWFYHEAKKRGVFDSAEYPPADVARNMITNKNDTNAITEWEFFLHR